MKCWYLMVDATAVERFESDQEAYDFMDSIGDLETYEVIKDGRKVAVSTSELWLDGPRED